MATVKLSDGTLVNMPEGISPEEELELLKRADPDAYAQAFPEPTAGDIAMETLKAVPRGVVDPLSGGLKGAGALAETNFGKGRISDALRYTGKAFEHTGEAFLGETPPEMAEKFPVQVGRAVGQIGGFMGTAMVAGPVAPFAAGAGMMAEEAYQDIQRFAHTDEEERKAVGYAAMLGGTEGIPIFRALKRIPEPVKNRLLGALVKGGKGGFEEAVQETFQQGGMNLIASDIVGYDENREVIEGLTEAASIGGTAGFIANTLLAGITGRKVNTNIDAGDPTSSRTNDPEVVEDATPSEEGVTPDNKEIVDVEVEKGTPPTDIPEQVIVEDAEETLEGEPPPVPIEPPKEITPEEASSNSELSQFLPRRMVAQNGETLEQTVKTQLRSSLVPTPQLSEGQLDQYTDDVMGILRARAASAGESIDQYIFKRGISVSPMAYDNENSIVLFKSATQPLNNTQELIGTIAGETIAVPEAGFQLDKNDVITEEDANLLDRLVKEERFDLSSLNVVPLGDGRSIVSTTVPAESRMGTMRRISNNEELFSPISIFQNQDPSTIIHELGHLFSFDLRGAELQTINNWLGYKDLRTPDKWDRNVDGKGQEKFATAFERYLYNGKVPKGNPGLREAFNRIKEVVRRVYATLKGSPIEYDISSKVRKVFDKLMTPDGMPTFLPEHEMPLSAWREVQGNMLADITGVGEGAMAVRRPTYTQTLRANIRKSTYYATPTEAANRLQIMSRPDFLNRERLTQEELLNRSVMYMATEATNAFHQGGDIQRPLQALEETLTNRDTELPNQVKTQIHEVISYVKRLQEFRRYEKVFNNSLREGLLEVQNEVGEPIVVQRDSGVVYRTLKENAFGKLLISLDGLHFKRVTNATLHTDFVSPEAVQPGKDWSYDRETFILEQHRRMVDNALEAGKNVPSYTIAPHINTDPVYQDAYNKALTREEAKRKIIEQREIVQEWKDDLIEDGNYQVAPITQVDKNLVDKTRVEAASKEQLLTISGFVDQSFLLLERLSNALDKGDRIKFLDVVEKTKLQRLTNMRGDVGSFTARDYLANLFSEMDTIKKALEDGSIDTKDHDQLAQLTSRVRNVYTHLETWEKRFKESGQASMMEPGATESQLTKIWDWAERNIPFIPESAGSNTIAMGLRKAAMTMHWMSRRFPILLPLYRMGSTQRFINATLQTNQLLNGMEAAETIEYTNKRGEVEKVQVQAPGLRAFRNIPDRGPVYVALQHILLTGDQLQKRFTEAELRELFAKSTHVQAAEDSRKLTPEEENVIITAYNEVQGTMEYMYYKLYQNLERLFGDKRASSVIHNLYPKGYIEGYFPHIRSGKYAVAVKNKETGETEYFSMYDRAVDQKAALRRLREKNPNSIVVPVDPSDRIDYQYGGGVDLITAIKDVISKADIQSLAENPEQAVQIEAALDEATAAIIKSHGMFSMFGERRNVEGFDERIKHVVVKRVHDFGAAIAKVEFAKNGTQALTELRSTPQIYNYAQDWFGAMLRDGDKHDAMVSKIRSLIFFKYLGFNVKTAMVVFADKITNAPARLGLHTQGAEKKLGKAMVETRHFMSWLQQVEKLAEQEGIIRNEAAKKIPIPDGFTQEKVNALLWSLDAGVSTAKFVPEVLEQEEVSWEIGEDSKTTKWGRSMDLASVGMQKAFNASSWMLVKVETFNRLSTFAAAYDVFRKEKGFSFDDAILNAEELVNDAHFLYGKPNIPMIFHRKGLGKWLRTFYTFRAFEHNYIQMLGDLLHGKGKRGKLMAAKSLTYLMALGGVPALPFFMALSKAIGAITGDDPEQEFLASLYKMDAPEFLAQSFSDGVPGLFGTTFRGSLQVGAYENMEDIIAGVAGSFVSDIAQSTKALYKGDWDMFARKALPTVAGNVYKAIEGREHGVLSAYGTPLREGVIGRHIKYNDAEFLQKLLSFNPKREADSYRMKRAMRTSDQYWSGRRQSIYSKFAKSVRTNDRAGLAAALQDVITYERDRLDQGALEVPAIDQSNLRQSLEEAGLRKREILQVLRLRGQIHGT